MVASTWPLSGSIFWILSSASWYRCRPSKAVPACAATSIVRCALPVAGLNATSLSPAANQTFRPSYVPPCTWSAPGKGPYSRTISALARFIRRSLVDRKRCREQQRCREPGNGRGGPAARPAAPERLHLACGPERIERPLRGALAGAERERQGRAGPGFAVGEESEHRSVLPFHGRRQHHDPAGPARRQREPLLRRAHGGLRPGHRAEPPDLDP